eukprot:TRINITY_DN44371_c0_g1_i1.p1 TRINITY_DN44371_c0_g1~~TRINITY_DN44371_c0_g1_i1.p1  ORF type:complete len:167 (+),score=24.19 TRINITY_DN44371_c0_g1_i1:100-600(+)
MAGKFEQPDSGLHGFEQSLQELWNGFRRWLSEQDARLHLTAVALVSLCVCLVILAAAIGASLLERWKERRQHPLQTCGVKMADIENNFPVVSVAGDPTCVVCISAIHQEDQCRILQCNHHFHADCIEDWWMHIPRNSLECPVCRKMQEIPSDRTTKDEVDDARGVC